MLACKNQMIMVFLGVTKKTREDYIVKAENELKNVRLKMDKLGILLILVCWLLVCLLRPAATPIVLLPLPSQLLCKNCGENCAKTTCISLDEVIDLSSGKGTVNLVQKIAVH